MLANLDSIPRVGESIHVRVQIGTPPLSFNAAAKSAVNQLSLGFHVAQLADPKHRRFVVPGFSIKQPREFRWGSFSLGEQSLPQRCTCDLGELPSELPSPPNRRPIIQRETAQS